MKKLRSPDELIELQNRLIKQRESEKISISICGETGCRACGCGDVYNTFKDEIRRRGLEETVDLKLTGCPGFCEYGPLVIINPVKIMYVSVTPEDAREILLESVLNVHIIDRLLYTDPISGEKIKYEHDIPFYKKQRKLVSGNNGLIDPTAIEDYLAIGGYSGLSKVLLEMQPEGVIDEIKKSGLRGRGGGGFPTGRKWESCRNAASRNGKPYVICNADEGDPGAYMDRSLLEGNPHSVIEGMLIGAYAIGSSEGYVYIRYEYPLAVKNLGIALNQAREYGLLGDDILGSGFSFDIKLSRGGGAFVCGESTALMASLEGKIGEPRSKHIHTTEKGLNGKPSNLNNVETWANVPLIIREGADWYSDIGTEGSKGTKIFSLVGKINNTGLVEVPMGISLREIIYDIGGGIPNGKKFKAVQTGGPSGGCIPESLIDIPVDYDKLKEVGSMMGSGGMIVMDEDTCMVDVARYFINFLTEESCGKCVPCRVGLDRMLDILTDITEGNGREGDIELLEELGEVIKGTALCALGGSAPNPVLSTIKYFREEYEAHIYDKRCPAAVCGELFDSPCQHICPVGMNIPAYVALIRANRFEDAYKILKKTNPFPSVCGRVCGHPCQGKCRRSQLDEPVAIKNLKRFITDNAPSPKVEEIPVTRKEKVAVIGGGPSGLTAALELKIRGYAVTVFEELPEAGGMLRWGIPAYRLPRDIIAREIQDILDTGVELRTGVRIGKDVSFVELENDYDFIYVAIGSQKSLSLRISGEDTNGVYGAVELLRECNNGNKVEFGKSVAVIGGGNSAIDSARTALREGADVTIFYRRERKDMPAQEAEIVAAEEEGVKIVYLVGPAKVNSQDGRVSGLELVKMQLGAFDKSGRRRPSPIDGSEFTADVNMVIAAIGQEADLKFIGGNGIDAGKGTIAVSKNLQTANPKVWAGGDVVTGPAMVIDAIKAGQDAARGIDEAIRAANGEKPWVPPKEEVIAIPFEVDEDPEEQPQAPMPELNPSERQSDYREVELGYSVEVALAEARRCLRCDGKGEE
jgi:NADH-quinone oxidoreductase subunit F